MSVIEWEFYFTELRGMIRTTSAVAIGVIIHQTYQEVIFMLDTTRFEEITKDCHYKNLDLIVKELDKLGVSRVSEACADFQFAYDYVRTKKPAWIEKFGCQDLDELQEEYKKMASGDKTKAKDYPLLNDYYSYMCNMAQSKGIVLGNKFRHGLSQVSQLFVILEFYNNHERELYEEGMSDVWNAHNRSQFYKIGPSSVYHFDLKVPVREGYYRQEEINLKPKDARAIARSVKFLAEEIYDTSTSIDPWDYDRTDEKARKNNNAGSTGYYLFSNTRSESVRDEVKQAAEFIFNAREEAGPVPSVDMYRVQFAPNVIADYVDKLYPDMDTPLTLPTRDQLVNIMSAIALERGMYVYPQPNEPTFDEALEGFSYKVELPQSYQAREQMVDDGDAPSYILNTFPDTGEFIHNWLVYEPNVWRLVSDVFGETHPLADEVYCKHRQVFNKSLAINRNGQRILYPLMDDIKERLTDTPLESFIVAWENPGFLKRYLTKLYSVINRSEWDFVPQQWKDLVATMFVVMSGDDKSGFDNYQPSWLTNIYYEYLLGPKVSEEYHSLLKYLSIGELFPILMAPDDVVLLCNIIESGGYNTNAKGTTNSFLNGLASALTIMDEKDWDKFLQFAKEVFLVYTACGDDFESAASEEFVSKMEETYLRIAGYLVALSKSLIDSQSAEYLRQQLIPLFKILDEEYGLPDSTMNGKRTRLTTHMPLFRTGANFSFPEDSANRSDAIAGMSQLNRGNNFIESRIAPEFIEHYSTLVPMQFGIEPSWYVPLQNRKAWIEDGKPGDGSKHHIEIKSIFDVLEAANMDADYLGSPLAQLMNIAWQDQNTDNPFSNFGQMRIVRIIEALRLNDMITLNKIREEIIPREII